MKYILFVIWIALLPLSLKAQTGTGSLSGKILLADGSAVSGISVQLKGTPFKTVTDKAGVFSLTASAGNYILIISFLSRSTESAAEIAENKVTELPLIRLQQGAIQLDEVVITGQFAPQSLRNSVYRVRTINSELIRLRAATSIESVLNTELGIRFSNDLTLGESDIQLMGMSGQNVKILLDGVPLVDRGATRQSISQIDINSIDRVEIVEGPMSVVYGTDALAGVINLITKKGNGQKQLSVTARLQEESVGNEYNSLVNKGSHNNNLGINWQGSKWQLSGAATRNNFGGWQGQATGRQKEWNPKDQLLTNGVVGYRTNKLNAWYRLDYLNEYLYSYGPMNINNYRARDQNYITNRFTHQAQAEWKISDKLNFNAAASYQDYKRRTKTTILDMTTGKRELSTGAGEQDESIFDTKFFRGTMQYKLSDAVSFQPGIEMNLNKGSGQRIKGSPSINDYAFFVSSEIIPARGISIRPGLRFSENSVYSAPRAIPSINTKFTLGKSIDLRLAYARGFRAPALRELYFNFFDASHSIEGNENLKAEYSNSFNGYLSWQSAGESSFNISSTLGGFYNRFNNQITTGYIGGNNVVLTYINIEKFRTEGATIENKIRWKKLQAMIGFSYIGRFNRLSEEEGSLPSVMWSPELNSNLIHPIPGTGITASLFYKFTGKRPAYEVSIAQGGTQQIRLTEIEGFNMADMSLSKNVMKYLTLTGGVRNIFNVTRIKNTSSDLGGAHSTGGPVPIGYGRSYFLGLNLQLNTSK